MKTYLANVTVAKTGAQMVTLSTTTNNTDKIYFNRVKGLIWVNGVCYGNIQWGTYDSTNKTLVITKSGNAATDTSYTLSLSGHTHSYAGAASAGGNAYTANKLANSNSYTTASAFWYWQGQAKTDANVTKVTVTDNKTAAASTGLGKCVPSVDSDSNYMVIGMNWGGTSGAYRHEIFACPNDDSLWHRRLPSSESGTSTWIKILDSSNWSQFIDLTALGASASGHKHAAGDITSGTLGIARGGTGTTSQANINKNFIADLEEGTSNFTDGTMLVTSYASDNGFADTNAPNKPYKRKASCMYNYIKSKLDSVYSAQGHGHNYAGSDSDGGGANTVKLTKSDANSWYPLVFASSFTTSADAQTLRVCTPSTTNINCPLRVYPGTNPSANTEGTTYLVVGNNLAKSSANNRTGRIRFYGDTVYYAELVFVSSATASRTFTFPNVNGTIYCSGNLYWGTNQTNYVPLTVGGTTYNLSKNGHTHDVISFKATVSGTTLYNGTGYSAGLSAHPVYNNSYPCTYGNALNLFGSGSSQVIVSWNADYTDDTAATTIDGLATEMYLRSRRDNCTKWTGWTRIVTNKNYSSIITPSGIGAAASTHYHNYIPTYLAGSNDCTLTDDETEITFGIDSDGLNLSSGSTNSPTLYVYGYSKLNGATYVNGNLYVGGTTLNSSYKFYVNGTSYHSSTAYFNSSIYWGGRTHYAKFQGLWTERSVLDLKSYGTDYWYPVWIKPNDDYHHRRTKVRVYAFLGDSCTAQMAWSTRTSSDSSWGISGMTEWEFWPSRWGNHQPDGSAFSTADPNIGREVIYSEWKYCLSNCPPILLGWSHYEAGVEVFWLRGGAKYRICLDNCDYNIGVPTSNSASYSESISGTAHTFNRLSLTTTNILNSGISSSTVLGTRGGTNKYRTVAGPYLPNDGKTFQHNLTFGNALYDNSSSNQTGKYWITFGSDRSAGIGGDCIGEVLVAAENGLYVYNTSIDRYTNDLHNTDNLIFYIDSSGAYYPSDARKKQNFAEITDKDVEKLFSTSDGYLKSFEYKKTGIKSFGVIAQEIQEYCPEAVEESDKDGFYHVNYDVALSKIVAALFKKVKTQDKLIKELLDRTSGSMVLG